MIRLGHQDFARVAEFLRELYAQTDATQLPDTLLAGLAQIIPGESLGYNDINARTNHITVVVQPFVAKVFELAPVIELLLDQHPVVTYHRHNPDRRTFQLSDFLSPRQFRRTGIYVDAYRHLDVEHQMTSFLSEQGAAADICVCLNRKHRAFSERDRTVLDLLRPHIIQARANALAFSKAGRQTRALADSLASLDANVVLLQPDGRVAWLAPQAQALLARFFPDSTASATQLPEPLAQWWRQRRAQAWFAGTLAEAQVPFLKVLGAARLTVHGRTEPDGTYCLLLTEERDFLLAAHAQQAGLTQREAEVLHWLSEGKNNPEIAVILQLSPRTVHKHVEHVFRKLGVDSRHAATLKVLDWKHGR